MATAPLSILVSTIAGTLFAFSTAASADDARIFFASDIHSHTSELATAVTEECVTNDDCDAVALVGDFNFGASYDASEQDVTNMIEPLPKHIPVILSGGNHDVSVAKGGDIPVTGLVSSGSSLYDFWVINDEDFNLFGNDTSAQREALDEYLSRNPGKYLFILCHYPLHSTRDAGRTSAAVNFFNYLNDKGEHRNIVVAWGHNHHLGYDNDVNNVALPSEYPCDASVNRLNNITVCSQTLNFTYLNAGYMTHDSAAVAPAYSIVTIDDAELEVWRSDTQTAKTTLRKNPLGDTNHDYVVNIVDALIIAQEYVGLNPPLFNDDVADVNEDGLINIVDSLVIAQYYVNLVESLPAYNQQQPTTDPQTIEEAQQLIIDAMNP